MKTGTRPDFRTARFKLNPPPRQNHAGPQTRGPRCRPTRHTGWGQLCRRVKRLLQQPSHLTLQKVSKRSLGWVSSTPGKAGTTGGERGEHCGGAGTAGTGAPRGGRWAVQCGLTAGKSGLRVALPQETCQWCPGGHSGGATCVPTTTEERAGAAESAAGAHPGPPLRTQRGRRYTGPLCSGGGQGRT